MALFKKTEDKCNLIDRKYYPSSQIEFGITIHVLFNNGK